MTLRERADELPRSEILERYARNTSAAGIIDTYMPLVTDLGADVVTMQMASLDQEALIEMLGRDVLPASAGRC